jgi:spore coat protein U-like protein
MSSGRTLAAGAAVVGLLAAAAAGAANCTFTVQSVAFGNYDTISGQSVNSAGSITVSCNVIDSYSISLSPGQGTLLVRQMRTGGYGLNYNLYTDALRTMIWGDGTSGTVIVSDTAIGGIYTVYGRIPANQNLPAGTYTDSITVTLNF